MQSKFVDVGVFSGSLKRRALDGIAADLNPKAHFKVCLNNANSKMARSKQHNFGLSQELSKFQKELDDWRNNFNIQQAKTESRDQEISSNKITMAVLCSGGCLDTFAGMRAGFQAKWSTEISAAQSRMFEDLTGGICLGDTFSDRVRSAEYVAYREREYIYLSGG